MALFKLNNTIQNYAWGSTTALTDLFGLENPDDKPQAEIWMGAHEKGCSVIDGSDMSLKEYIDLDPNQALGDKTAKQYGELPYLFKVLAAQAPLSIQVHPSKQAAKQGYEHENAQGIDLSAPYRNYKDPNHKPELVYALTPYKAMNGFRPVDHIIALFDEFAISALSTELLAFKHDPSEVGLKAFFTSLLTLSQEKRQQAIMELMMSCQRLDFSPLAKEASVYCQVFAGHYTDDVGILAPLILNTIELKPGEAMFLDAETPHAYVQGTALEIMANSDNVLRAGLTPKHIDVPALIENTRFTSIAPEVLTLTPKAEPGRVHFPVPVEDFKFEVLSLEALNGAQAVQSAEILFCIDGQATVIAGDERCDLQPGESAFITYNTRSYECVGYGRLARAFN